MLSFAPFRSWFVTKHPTGKRMDFQKETGFSPSTAAKVWADKLPVKSDIIDRICETYNLQVNEVIKYEKGETDEGIS